MLITAKLSLPTRGSLSKEGNLGVDCTDGEPYNRAK